MRVLIISATEKEVFPIMDRMGIDRIVEGRVICGRYDDLDIDILITGPGILAGSYVISKAVANNHGKWSYVLNLGIAGSFKKSIPIGKVVNVICDIQADFGAEDQDVFLTASEIGLCAEKDYIFHNNEIIGNEELDHLQKVKGTTVNTVHGNEPSIKRFEKQFSPDIETMEGAAFFYTVLQENVPCMQIRSISNYVEKRDKTKWDIDLAIQNLNAVILKALEKGFE